MIFNTTDTAKRMAHKNTTVDEALSTVEDELTANNKRIYLDYKDGKYGYNTESKRGADTFHPFNTGNQYTQLRTIDGVGADELGTYTGCGYITLTRAWGTAAEEIHVYIDGSNTPLTIYGVGTSQFYFKQSIRFSGGNANNGYYVQLLTAEKAVDEYTIVQSAGIGTTLVTYEGKGKILFTPMFDDLTLYFSLDGGFMSTIPIKFKESVWLTFHERMSFSCANEDEWVQFIAYLQK